jgi:hypothetical protein
VGHVIQPLQGDGPVELVACELPGVVVDAGQLLVVIKHFLKVGGTTQYIWIFADSPAGAGLTFQRTACRVSASTGKADLLAQFSAEFHGGCLQVASLPVLLQEGNSFGW